MVDGLEKDAPEQTLKVALEQINSKRYAEDLESVGVKEITKLAIAFRAKELWLREG